MGSIRDQPKMADLFEDAGQRSAPSPPTSTKRHVLPSNLPAAVRQLRDDELDQLLSAVLAEQKRRGTDKITLGTGASRQQGKTHAAGPPLSVGKLNAIRAAFKAGLRPSRIAREFGLSESDVRKALAADK
jgi:hypothetical protein